MKLYRGSSNLTKVIYPETLVPDDLEKLKSAGIDARKAIWATSSKTHAIIFALFSGQATFQIDTGTDGSGKIEEIIITLSKEYLNKFEKEDLNKKAYLYEFDSKDFVQVNQLEWVCLEDTTNFTYKTNTKSQFYEILKKDELVKFIRISLE
ncbi:hypothetical protein KC660_00815 [Candidatus Dojkabacteria bacterium]|uniref:Uncharacterized protein n=1 Tax=Candidatus Dojkabacteria bacterium TaxID=2099670 RepID=A0A955L3A0_9BACT|nr:hypothetical protein [Candidatus Dojkabacteria bacterium]